MAKDVQDGTKTERPMKKIPVLYKEELAPLDFKWDGKGWSNDKTAVDSYKEQTKIPEIYPTQDGTSQRLSIYRGKQGLPEKLAELVTTEYDGGSPMDYMDAPATGAMKAFSFIGKPDADALQLAISRMFMNGDKRADLLMKMSPKSRDEFTTAWHRFMEEAPDVPVKASGRGHSANVKRRSDGKFLNDPDTDVNIGGANYHRIPAENDGVPFHESYHMWDDATGAQEGRANEAVKFVDKFGLKRHIPYSTINQTNREFFDDNPIAKVIQANFAGMKVKDLPDNFSDYYKVMKPKMQSDIDKGLLTDDDAEQIAIGLWDAITSKRPKNDGLFQTEKGGGRLPAYVAGHEKNYAKDWEGFGIDADIMEGNANLAGLFANPRTARWLEKNGMKEEGIWGGGHLNYTPEQEEAVALAVRESPEYKAIQAEGGVKNYVPKMRADIEGSKLNKFFNKEYEYRKANPEYTNSPDWTSAVREGWIGDRRGAYDVDEMKDLFNRWMQKNNLKLDNPQTLSKTEEARKAVENSNNELFNSLSEEQRNLIFAMLDEENKKAVGRFDGWYKNLNPKSLNAFNNLQESQAKILKDKILNGGNVTFNGKYWMERVPSETGEAYNNWRVINFD